MKRSEIPRPAPGHREASAAVSAALGTLPYPISKQEAIQKVGDWQVPYAEDAKIPLGQLLEAFPQEELTDPNSAAQAVDRYWARIANTLATVERAERRSAKK